MQAISTLRNLLKKRQDENQQSEGPGMLQFSLCFPNASKVDVFVKANSSTNVHMNFIIFDVK